MKRLRSLSTTSPQASRTAALELGEALLAGARTGAGATSSAHMTSRTAATTATTDSPASPKQAVSPSSLLSGAPSPPPPSADSPSVPENAPQGPAQQLVPEEFRSLVPESATKETLSLFLETLEVLAEESLNSLPAYIPLEKLHPAPDAEDDDHSMRILSRNVVLYSRLPAGWIMRWPLRGSSIEERVNFAHDLIAHFGIDKNRTTTFKDRELRRRFENGLQDLRGFIVKQEEAWTELVAAEKKLAPFAENNYVLFLLSYGDAVSKLLKPLPSTLPHEIKNYGERMCEAAARYANSLTTHAEFLAHLNRSLRSLREMLFQAIPHATRQFLFQDFHKQ